MKKKNTPKSPAILFAGSLAATLASQAAETPAPDKSGYNFFKPTPREHMRELSTDRPDKTESAYTVDAGHFQIESDIVSYSRDHDTSAGADTRVESWSIGAVNLKAGLLNWMDLQVVIDTYNRVSTDDKLNPPKVRQSGFGDITTRLKMNVWGNDGGSTALALMPFLKLPTNQDQLGNNAIEGGLIIPLAVELPAGWAMGLMTEFDSIQNSTDKGYHAEFINTVTFSHDLTEKLGFYIEFFSMVSSEAGAPWVGTVDLGLTYGVSKNLQLDAGINIGVTRSAEDINPFIGFAWRF